MNESNISKIANPLFPILPDSAIPCPLLTPSLNDKIDSGNTHLQDLARWWRTSKGFHIPKISQFYWGLFEKTRFFMFLHYKIKQKTSQHRAKIPLNLTSEGLKYPPEVGLQHETCSTISGTPVKANILTFPDLPYQFFWVQNSFYRCPTYSTTRFMLNSHPWGVF